MDSNIKEILKEILYAVFVSAMIFFITFYIIQGLTGHEEWGALAGIISFCICIYYLYGKMIIGVKDEDLKYYSIAEQEITSGNIEENIWSFALVKAKGNEEKRSISLTPTIPSVSRAQP